MLAARLSNIDEPDSAAVFAFLDAFNDEDVADIVRQLAAEERRGDSGGLLRRWREAAARGGSEIDDGALEHEAGAA